MQITNIPVKSIRPYKQTIILTIPNNKKWTHNIYYKTKHSQYKLNY